MKQEREICCCFLSEGCSQGCSLPTLPALLSHPGLAKELLSHVSLSWRSQLAPGTPGGNTGAPAAPGPAVRPTQAAPARSVCSHPCPSLTNNSLHLLSATRKCKYNSLRLCLGSQHRIISAFPCKGRHESRNYVISFSSVQERKMSI